MRSSGSDSRGAAAAVAGLLVEEPGPAADAGVGQHELDARRGLAGRPRSRRRRCGSARSRSGSGTTAPGRRTSCRPGRGRPRAGGAGRRRAGETEPHEWYAGWISGARATGAESSPSRSRCTSDSQLWSGRKPVTTTTSSTPGDDLAVIGHERHRPRRECRRRGRCGSRSPWSPGRRRRLGGHACPARRAARAGRCRRRRTLASGSWRRTSQVTRVPG